MGLFNWLERKMVLGQVVHDFGLLGEESIWWVKTSTYALLCRRKGRLRLVLKQTHRAPLAIGVNYARLDMNHDLLRRLREIDSVASKII